MKITFAMKNIKLLLFLFLLPSTIPMNLTENYEEYTYNYDDEDYSENQEKNNSQRSLTSDNPPFFMQRDLPLTIGKPAGNTVQLKCLAGGNPPPNVTWSRDGSSPSRNSGLIKYPTVWSLTMEDLIPEDSGNYTCVVCNTIGCINHTFQLEVVGRHFSAPLIVSGYPKNITVRVNSKATFECPTLSDNEPFIRWIKSINASEGRDNPLKKVTLQSSNDDIDNPQILELDNVTFADAGWYTCAAANGLGIVYAQAYLNVTDHLDEKMKNGGTFLGYGSLWLKFYIIIILKRIFINL